MRARWIVVAVTMAVILLGSVLLGSSLLGPRAWAWGWLAFAMPAGLLLWLSVSMWQNQTASRTAVLAILAFGLLARLSTLPSSRHLSDDAYRYHWDGKVTVAGINPYLYPPASPALDELRGGPLDHRLNHPHLRTIYPPLAQHLFALAWRLTPDRLIGLRLVILVGELIALALLAVERRRLRLSAGGLLLVAGSPLLILEGYLPGHVDSLTLPWMAALIIALTRRWSLLTGVSLAAACLIKPLALIFVPAAARELGVRRSLIAAGVFAALAILGYLPFLAAGGGLVESMGLMARQWSYNGSVAALLEGALPREVARLSVALALAALLLWTAWRGRSLASRTTGAALAFVALTPTLFPWYAAGLVPIFALTLQPAALALLTLLPLAGLTAIRFRLGGDWRPSVWTQWVIYLPFYGLLGWAARGGLRRATRGSNARPQLGQLGAQDGAEDPVASA